MNEPIQKSVKQRLVYDFFYPGILGSILYDILPIEFSVIFFIKLTMVLFFGIDYFHLYFLMDKKFKQLEKDTWTYVGFDLLVAISIFVGFRYSGTNTDVSLFSMAIIPMWFLLYSAKLKYNIPFHLCYTISCILISLFIYKYKYYLFNYNATILIFFIIMTLVYLVYLINQVRQIK